MNDVLWSQRFATAAAGAALLWGLSATMATANECGDDEDFGECRVLIELNTTDGDIGFHWLTDGDDLITTRITDPNGAKVYDNRASGPLREQKLTETFGESAEPVCWDDGDVDLDEIVTLRDFREIWDPGTYTVRGRGDGGEMTHGEAELTYYLPAAPTDLTFNVNTGVMTWKAGDDLGNCTPEAPDSLQALVDDDVLGALPENVPVIAWEAVLEPDVDDTDPRASLVFSTRVAGPGVAPVVGTMYSLTVPPEYLASLGDDTPVKIEIGAIGGDFAIVSNSDDEVDGDDDNASFTEEDGFCVNEDEGCEDD